MKSTSNYEMIQKIAETDVHMLWEKGKTYGDSWKKRGGIGAMMMLARKIDRIENICEDNGYDIFKCGVNNIGDIMDDIRDLRRYLLLVEDEVLRQKIGTPNNSGEPDCNYTNQDPDLKKVK